MEINSFYKMKYLKYKQKNKMLLNQNAGSYEKYKNNENSLFEEFGIQTFQKMDDEDTYENVEFPDKFFISCHGSRFTNKSIAKIIVPKDFVIYFQAEMGATCKIDSGIDTITRICYNDEELVSLFKNVSYGKYTEFDIKPEFWNRKWLNKYVEGSVINDCILSGDIDTDEISSMVVFCSNVIGGQILLKFSHKENHLLSQILVKLLKYIEHENIQPPYNVFCSFCLTNDDNYYKEIYEEQSRISQHHTNLYTFNSETSPVDY